MLAPLPQLMLAPRQPYTCTFMVASTQAQCHKLALCPCMLGLGPCGCRAALQTNSCCTIPVPAYQAGAGPPAAGVRVSSALARLPFFGGGGTQCKGLLSQQMASQVGHYHPKCEGGKVVSAVVMPPQAHRELQGKQNKTKHLYKEENPHKSTRTIFCLLLACS